MKVPQFLQGENIPRLLRGAARVASGLAGLGSFFVFASAAAQDRTATATAAAGLCLALAVLAALDLESFEGLGIKAKLRTTLSDAEARLNGLDTIIRSLARSAFVQAAQNPMTDLARRAAIDEMTAALRDADVSTETIEAFKRPVYIFIAARLWYVATMVRATYISRYVQALEEQERRLAVGPEQDALRTERERLMALDVAEHPHGDNFERFRALADRIATETPVMMPEHRHTFVAAMGEISDIYDECRRAGNLTDRAMAAIGAGNALGTPYVNALMTRFVQPQG